MTSEYTVPPEEFHYFNSILLMPLRNKVARVKKRGSSGSATRREIEMAMRIYRNTWQDEELQNILSELNN